MFIYVKQTKKSCDYSLRPYLSILAFSLVVAHAIALLLFLIFLGLQDRDYAQQLAPVVLDGTR